MSEKFSHSHIADCKLEHFFLKQAGGPKIVLLRKKQNQTVGKTLLIEDSRTIGK